MTRESPSDVPSDRASLSYSVFFAAFDITRRTGLRVKAFFGGPISSEYDNIISFTTPGEMSTNEQTPSTARVAQAITIVAGGVTASLAAEMAGRPFRACQNIMQAAKTNPSLSAAARNPILAAYRAHGIRPFIQSGHMEVKSDLIAQSRLRRVVKRVGWRLAAVGPWGFGFLVWAWVGGEV